MGKKKNSKIDTLKKSSNMVLAKRRQFVDYGNVRKENFSLITTTTIKTTDDIITGKPNSEEERDKA